MVRRKYREAQRRRADRRYASLFGGNGKPVATTSMQATGKTVPFPVGETIIPVPVMTVKWADERQWCGPAMDGATECPAECPSRVAATEQDRPFCDLMGAEEQRPCIFDAPGDPVWAKVRRNRQEWVDRQRQSLPPSTSSGPCHPSPLPQGEGVEEKAA